ncbi:MAG: bifunctional adenosylcobinamide kinase/adenosylcobinamide-phosphate guanylyltransferase [Chloroflexota bacterium]
MSPGLGTKQARGKTKVNTLITGRGRSGKSTFAQELARQRGGPVLFVATAEAGDDEMRRRIERHRRERPAGWRTLEGTTGLGPLICREAGGARVVILDCVTLLVSNVLGHYYSADGGPVDDALVEAGVTAEIDGLVACLGQTGASFIVVTNEVGLGLVPDNRAGRLYRDLLGRANQRLAAAVDEVYFMVAGLPLRIKG